MNLPDEFIEKYTKLLGDEAESFFESFDTEPQKGFRLNPLKSNYQNGNLISSVAEPPELSF